MTRAAAIRAIHFPETWEARDAAHEHLVLYEFFAMQMLIASRRADASIRTGRGALRARGTTGQVSEVACRSS